MTVVFSLQTSPSGSGAAIAVIQLIAASAEQLNDALAALGIAPVEPGRLALRDLLGIDTGIVARWTPTCVHLMPHGGALIVRQLCEALAARGIAPATDAGGADPRAEYPEARTLFEACLLQALARAASPLAIDVLLRQRDLWENPPAAVDALAIEARARVLNRLIDPPLVVAVGPPNVGKSTLTNALARREVSIVEDEPGTTRDHVGVLLDLAGLVVRWMDCPGFRALPDGSGEIERAAIELARSAAAGADLVLSCGDAASGFLESSLLGSVRAERLLRIGTRGDLGPARGAEVQTAAANGQGLSDLAREVRQRLVSNEHLESRTPWRFHNALAPEPGSDRATTA